MTDKMRSQFVAEIKRLQDAIDRTTSEHLIRDYTKAIKRMKKELRVYDAYKRGGDPRVTGGRNMQGRGR